jgi:Ser/Thr protein kinase RdoA (MazF antagonist)
VNREPQEQAILHCLAGAYGIEGTLSRLPGENLNYLLSESSDQRFVVKIVDQDMPPEVIELQSAVIEHALQQDIGFDLPQIYVNQYRNLETYIESDIFSLKRLHVIHYVSGDVLYHMPDISQGLLRNVGECLARLHRAMADFDHAAAHRSHRWNLAEAGVHRDKIGLFEGEGQRATLNWAFDRWEEEARSRFDQVPQQIIHGDPFSENILVTDNRVSGIVDFGDCCFNPRICDLAICLAYLMMGQRDPQHIADVVTEGYEAVSPISMVERDMLMPLVCARLAVTISVAEERKRIDPDNPNWFGDQDIAFRLLSSLRRVSSLP